MWTLNPSKCLKTFFHIEQIQSQKKLCKRHLIYYCATNSAMLSSRCKHKINILPHFQWNIKLPSSFIEPHTCSRVFRTTKHRVVENLKFKFTMNFVATWFCRGEIEDWQKCSKEPFKHSTLQCLSSQKRNCWAPTVKIHNSIRVYFRLGESSKSSLSKIFWLRRSATLGQTPWKLKLELKLLYYLYNKLSFIFRSLAMSTAFCWTQ